MSLDFQVMEKYVQRGMDEFDRNPLASQLLRRLSHESPELFFRSVVKHLNSPDQSNAHRMLTMLLLKQDGLSDFLASPAFGTQESSVRLLKRLLAVDPSFDVKFAKKLPGRTYWNHAQAFDSLRSSRALDILDETSQGRRLLPILGHLPDSQDSKIAAKATLFVGHRVQNAQWARRQLDRGDQRVRANAVEALWGVKTPQATRLLEDCTRDRNNRVVGNALVGLHLVGQETARTEVMSLSKQGKPELRSTAAWAMGKLALSDFAPRLTELVRDDHPEVRSSALRSLILIRRTESPAGEPEVLTVAPAEPQQPPSAPEWPSDSLSIPSWANVPAR
jgi:HEAT repeat protein